MTDASNPTWEQAEDAPVHLGNFYEDFTPGTVYRHRLGRTITETDNIWFTLLTMNTNPLHFDRVYAGSAELDDILINSTFTLSVVTGLSVADISENAVANLAWDDVKLPAPVRIGDTLRAETLILSKRESGSRPHAGIVRFATRGLNQNEEVVVSFERTILVYKRGFGPRFPGSSLPE